MKIDSIKNGIVIDHITAGKAMELYFHLGLDKLDWDNVYEIICEVFEDMDVEILICEL